MGAGIVLCFFTVISYLLCQSYAWVPFTLTDCTNYTDRVVTITGGPTQYPITIPGHVSAPSSITIHRPVSGGFRLDVVVQKYIVFDYFMLPCISNVGSCSYDICELLSWFERRGCPRQVSRSNIPCWCPYQNGTYSMGPYPFHIPRVSGVWEWIAYGDFRVTGRLVDIETDEEVNCYTLDFTVQQPYYSWGDYWNLW